MKFRGFARRVLPLVAGASISIGMLSAQGGGQQPPTAPPTGAPGGTPGGTPSPSPGRGDRIPTTPDPRQRQEPQFPEMQRPVFLQGKVLMEDGTPPPDSVTIEKVCNGMAVPQAYTDSKGRFHFQVGQTMGVMPDASVSSGADSEFGGPGMARGGGIGGQRMPGGMGGPANAERSLMGCELRASLPGFRSDVVQLTSRRSLDNPDVGTIVLRRLANVEGFTTSMTSMLAPKDAKKAFEKGREAAKKNKLEDAEKQFAKAVELYPKYAVAWFELGRLLEQKENAAEARKAYASAMEADSKLVSPYIQLAGMALRESQWQEVLDTSDRAIRLNPVDFPQAHFYNAVANLQLQKLDAAEKSAREALRLDERKRMPKIQHVLGIILAQKQDYAGAAEYMKAYIELAPKAGDVENVRKQLAEVDRLRGASTVGQKQPE